MEELFASGRIIDLILGFMALEAAALFAYRQRFGRGLEARRIVSLMLPGLFLLLALRTALVAGSWPIISALLFIALLCHLVDLAGRSGSSGQG